MNREDARIAIAKVLHEYDHPEYSTCTYCVFCLWHADFAIDELPPKEVWDASDTPPLD